MKNDNDLVKRLVECRTDYDGSVMPDRAEPIGCDCGLLREAGEEIERLRVVGADLQAARERAYDNRDMALQAVEEVERERDLWKSQVHDEIAANLAFRADGGALQDEDMPTFCERIIAERDALRARIEGAPVAVMDTRASLGICAPTEADFPAIYALQGKCVALVVVDD